MSLGQVDSVGVVLLRGRVTSGRVESAEDLGLSHEWRSAGGINKSASFRGKRVPMTLRTTEVARACSCEGWISERAESERGRVEYVGKLFVLSLFLRSNVGK